MVVLVLFCRLLATFQEDKKSILYGSQSAKQMF